jgi:hypothetical protein
MMFSRSRTLFRSRSSFATRRRTGSSAQREHADRATGRRSSHAPRLRAAPDATGPCRSHHPRSRDAPPRARSQSPDATRTANRSRTRGDLPPHVPAPMALPPTPRPDSATSTCHDLTCTAAISNGVSGCHDFLMPCGATKPKIRDWCVCMMKQQSSASLASSRLMIVTHRNVHARAQNDASGACACTLNAGAIHAAAAEIPGEAWRSAMTSGSFNDEEALSGRSCSGC